MLEKIKETIKQYNMLAAGDKIVVACSGGPDSLALLHIFDGFRLEYNISIFAVHVDHMFRGLESAQEADFVVDFCRKKGITCYRTAIDVPKFIKESGLSALDAARVARYQYLRSIAEKLGSVKIATGHHRDDQAETVLMHIIRGAGSAGVGGMQPINDDIIRPLLSVTRAEINEYCTTYHLEPRTDSSNLKTSYLRNRIRIELFPDLEKNYNSAIKDALCRTATIVGDEHDFIQGTAKSVWHKIVTEQASGIFINAKKMQSLHIAVRREIMRMAIEKTQGCLRGISFYHLEGLLKLLDDGRVGSLMPLPGDLTALKRYDGLYLGMPDAALECNINGVKQILMVPGTTVIDELGITITTELTDEHNSAYQPYVAVFDWLALSAPLFVRTRLNGDRFKPLGFQGTKKLKDFLVDAKIPREKRDCIPIICDQHNIIWVGGYRQAEVGKVTDKTKKFFKITIN